MVNSVHKSGQNQETIYQIIEKYNNGETLTTKEREILQRNELITAVISGSKDITAENKEKLNKLYEEYNTAHSNTLDASTKYDKARDTKYDKKKNKNTILEKLQDVKSYLLNILKPELASVSTTGSTTGKIHTTTTDPQRLKSQLTNSIGESTKESKTYEESYDLAESAYVNADKNYTSADGTFWRYQGQESNLTDDIRNQTNIYLLQKAMTSNHNMNYLT